MKSHELLLEWNMHSGKARKRLVDWNDDMDLHEGRYYAATIWRWYSISLQNPTESMQQGETWYFEQPRKISYFIFLWKSLSIQLAGNRSANDVGGEYGYEENCYRLPPYGAESFFRNGSWSKGVNYEICIASPTRWNTTKRKVISVAESFLRKYIFIKNRYIGYEIAMKAIQVSSDTWIS